MSDDTPQAEWRLDVQENLLRLALTLPTPTSAGEQGSVTHQYLEKSLNNYLRIITGRWGKQNLVRLAVGNQLLDTRQLQAIAGVLKEQHLELQWLETNRRQTAVAGASMGLSVDQTVVEKPLVEAAPAPPKPLVIRQTIRSGGEIRHGGDVVIIGDVNPGSSVVADGDILIWGCLRGTAHAGAKGNDRAVIMILRLAACQIRIADRVARAGSDNGEAKRQEPEIAYITSEGIHLTPVSQFQRPSFATQTTPDLR